MSRTSHQRRQQALKKQARTRFRGCLELLERRLMLTGPYTNFPLDSNTSSGLLEGARDISQLGDRMAQSDHNAQPLGPIRNLDGSPLTPGLLGPYGRVLREEVENPISDYFDATPVDQRSSDALIAHLGANPAFLTIEGGLVDGTIDELVFDIHLQREFEISLVNLEFDSESLPSPFFTKNGVELNLSAILDVHYVFGMTLDGSLNLEQSFFIREFEASSAIRADTVLHPFAINLGILEASVPDVVLAASLDIHVSQPTNAPTLRLTEINTLETAELFTTTIGTDQFDATFNIDAGIGQWRLEGSTYLTAIGSWLGFDPAITFSPNFDELFLFGNISGGDIVAGFENLQGWLSSLSNSSQYSIPIPFTKNATTGAAYDLGEGMSGFTSQLRDEDGLPAFDNVGDFPYSGAGIDYLPGSNKIVLIIATQLPEQQLQSRSTRVSVDDTLGLDSNTEAQITGSGRLNLVVSLDLSEESDFNQLEPVTFMDRVAVEHLSITADYGAEAVVLTGNAAYGGLGLAFANAVLSGQFSTQIEIGDLALIASHSLRTLGSEINTLSNILVRPIEWLGDISLRVPSLSVMGNLFGLAADAFVEVSVDNLGNSIIETTTNAPDLLNFADLTFEGLSDSLSEALLGTQSWDSEGDAAVATLGVSLDEFGPLKQDRIADALTDAVEQADNVAGLARRIVQDVPDLVEGLEVAAGGSTVQFVSDLTYNAATGVLSWLVDASAEETSTVDVGLGFTSLFDNTGDANVSDTQDLVGEEASLPATSFSRLLLGLEFDPPPGIGARSEPNSFINSQSHLERTLYVNATPTAGSPVVIEGAAGAIGMKLRNGSVIVAQDLNAPDPASPARFFSTLPVGTDRVRISELPSFVPARTTLGRLRGDFQVVPDHTGTAETNRLTFRVNNFNNPTNSTTLQSSPNFAQMKQALNLQVDMHALKHSLNDWFKQVGERVAEEVLGKAYPLVGDKLDEIIDFVNEIRTAISSALDALSSFSVSDIENAMEGALSALIGVPADYIRIDISSPTQVKLTLDISDRPNDAIDGGASILEHQTQHTNLGLPALGIDLLGELEVIGAYEFKVTFVLDVNEGLYVETNSDQIGFSIDVNMLGQATGKLGFFEVIATATAPAPGQSAFHAEYAIDLTEPSGDDKLFLSEIGTGPLIDTQTSGLSGEAHLSFSIEAVVSDWLPSLETGLRIDWQFDGIGFDSSNPPQVTYEGIQLHLGRLLEEVLLPFFESIQKVFEPLDSTIKFLTDPLPVLKDFTDPPKSIIGLAKDFSRTLPADSEIRQSIESLSAFIETLASINKIVSAIEQEKGSGLLLELGDITFGGTASPQFDARTTSLDSKVVDEAITRTDLHNQFDSGAPKLADELAVSPGSLHLPIIEDPLGSIGWILGVGEANLITWDLPDVTVSFPVDFTFNVFPGILASIFGGLEIGTDLKVGLDTAGFAAYSRSRELKDLFQGFYVSDRANADGTGADTNELYIRGELFAGAGVGVEILGVGVSLIVGGGVFAEFGLDLLDHDNDGKVRGLDLKSSEGCFALNGELGVALEAKAKVGILKYELPVAEVTLLSGRKEFACPFYEPPPPDILAGLDPATRTLTLFMGTEAHRRNVSPEVERENFKVQRVGTQLIVTAFGASQSFESGLVGNIVADAGSDDDQITLIDVDQPTILKGGSGDDVIIGGSNTDFIDGGQGRDEIHGGPGDDDLIGSFGDDLLYGDAGEDDIFGGEGGDRIWGGTEDDFIDVGLGRNTAFGDDGIDTIQGGPLVDKLFGGAGDDTISGDAGNDVIQGEAGIDTLNGGLGDDTIDGGEDGDFIFGEDGDDRLWGRAGIDQIDGGQGKDLISGGEGGDSLFGRQDADEIYGDEDDDTIEGAQGDDLIYGGNGADTISGGSDRDSIYGGNGPDTISGDNGDDELYGEQGNDTISGGAGNDTIEGGGDSDTIYGFEMNLLAEDLPANSTDVDSIRGGQGFDRIAGGPDDDEIYGNEDADILLGNEGADLIEGHDGEDTIYGFHLHSIWSPVDGGVDSPNRLFGNLGDDEVHAGPIGDFIRGQGGNDRIFGADGPDTIYGDDGNDVILAGPEIDLIDAGLGNDFVEGNDGADQVYGNRGIDTLIGNAGDDLISGNDQADFIYGDEDSDVAYGGAGNDTIRGGDGDDQLFGDQGDDLILGFTGIDTIQGDEGDDVIYGGTQNDTIHGGLGNDRIYGELGLDQLFGDEGNDVVEGGAGDDIIEGNAGLDSLYGDEGQDSISGGDNDDYLFAGGGITNLLNGDQGNDVLVGSDDGTDDPKPTDSTFFGDRLNGGDGDDQIDGLGGGDIIDGGTGNNSVRSGTHSGSLINGTEVPIDVQFAMPTGPERRGLWAELSRSASDGGLTEVGGFEQSVFATEAGIYVAWVDWRSGNSEIYVAYHPFDVGGWTPLAGFGAFNSASGGGISNDQAQSRRPTLFKSDSSDSLVVAWTSISADGSSNIEVAREDTGWSRLPNPGQTGTADHAQFVPFGSHSGMLFWLDDSQGADRTGLSISQYVHIEGCVNAFRPAGGIGQLSSSVDVKSFDAAAVEFRAAVAVAYGSASDQDIGVFQVTGSSVDESVLCPGVPGVNAQEYVTGIGWNTPTLYSVTDGDTQNPDLGIQFISKRGVTGEEQLATDIVVAWEYSSQRVNQVDGAAIQIPLEGPMPPVQQLIPQYADQAASVNATTISETLGFATKPEVAVSYAGTFVAWQDDGVFGDSNQSSVFVLSRQRDTSSVQYILSEQDQHDASGQGISQTGGSLQSLTLAVARDGFFGSYPYAVWTEASTPLPEGSASSASGSNVYLRVTQPGMQAIDDQFAGRKHHGASGNVLENDLGLFGEVQGFLVAFDGKSFETGSVVEFTSPLGAAIQAFSDGQVFYSTQGVEAFRRLKRGEFLVESFVYQVDNFIHQAEAIVQFVIFGDNRWRNSNRNIDINDDGIISPQDALKIINDLNANGSRVLDDIGPTGKYFPDVNDDGRISASDVLQVINFLNSRKQGGGEGEAINANMNQGSRAELGPQAWFVDYSDLIYGNSVGLGENRTQRKSRK